MAAAAPGGRRGGPPRPGKPPRTSDVLRKWFVEGFRVLSEGFRGFWKAFGGFWGPSEVPGDSPEAPRGPRRFSMSRLPRPPQS